MLLKTSLKLPENSFPLKSLHFIKHAGQKGESTIFRHRNTILHFDCKTAASLLSLPYFPSITLTKEAQALINCTKCEWLIFTPNVTELF